MGILPKFDLKERQIYLDGEPLKGVKDFRIESVENSAELVKLNVEIIADIKKECSTE